jgi:tyrosyl-tRNA synthetase
VALRSPLADVEALMDGCAHVETPAELRARVQRGKPLRVKFGVDPTGSELHLGHAVVLHKMQAFVEAGHDVTLLIGDFTALIGDPSGRNDARPHLTREAIAENMRTYTEQAGKILDLERIAVRYNSEWLTKLDLADLIRLLSQTTVAQMLSREDFRNRYTQETPIALHEFLYPVAQAYDSVALTCDVELGGDDQLFNFLLARTYQTNAGQPAQICMTLPILEGTDGKMRMGKSKGNYIGLTESPHEQFGKTMRIPDELITRWMRLADFQSQAVCDAVERGIRDGTRVAMDEKKALAQGIVARYHGAVAARDARDYFERTVQRKERPKSDEIPHAEMEGGKPLVDAILGANFAQSKREAQRLIAEGAVRIDGEVVTDRATRLPTRGTVELNVGSRRNIIITLVEQLPTFSDSVDMT